MNAISVVKAFKDNKDIDCLLDNKLFLTKKKNESYKAIKLKQELDTTHVNILSITPNSCTAKSFIIDQNTSKVWFTTHVLSFVQL